MNNFKTIIVIAGILVAGVAFSSVAQEKPKEDGELKTLYSYKQDKASHKQLNISHKHIKHGAKAHKMPKQVKRHKAYKHKMKHEAKQEI